MADVDPIVRGAAQVLLLLGWILLSAFGVVLYLSLKGLPKEVVGARLFLNLDKVGRGFLLLSMGFGLILLAAVPSSIGASWGQYAGLAGSAAWFSTTLLSMLYLFKSLYVPRSVRKKFGAPSSLP